MTDTLALDPVLAEHIAAVNAFDEDAIVATFAADALVNDARREFWGIEAIRRWVAREIVGDKVTLQVTEVIYHYGHHRPRQVRRRIRQDEPASRRPDHDQLLHRPGRQDRHPHRHPEHARQLLTLGGRCQASGEAVVSTISRSRACLARGSKTSPSPSPGNRLTTGPPGQPGQAPAPPASPEAMPTPCWPGPARCTRRPAPSR